MSLFGPTLCGPSLSGLSLFGPRTFSGDNMVVNLRDCSCLSVEFSPRQLEWYSLVVYMLVLVFKCKIVITQFQFGAI